MKTQSIISETLPEDEAAFQAYVVEFLQLNGWRIHHSLRVWTKRGHRTPLQGSPGLPDVIATQGGRIAFLELKSDAGRLSGDQVEWLNDLSGVGRDAGFWNGRLAVPPHTTKGEPWDVLVGVLRPRWAKGGSGWFETTFTMIPGLVI